MGLLKLTLPLVGLAAIALNALVFVDPAQLPPGFKAAEMKAAMDESALIKFLVFNWTVCKITIGAIALVSPALGAKTRFWVGLVFLGSLAAHLYSELNFPWSKQPMKLDFQEPAFGALAGMCGALALGLAVSFLEPGFLTSDKAKKSKKA